MTTELEGLLVVELVRGKIHDKAYSLLSQVVTSVIPI